MSYALQFYRALTLYLKRLIHPRRLIISSEKKVMQLTIGVRAQLCVLLLFVCGVMWSSYATGRFMAAHHVLVAQRDTIKSVAASKTEHMLSGLLPSNNNNKDIAENLTLINSDHIKLAALEQQVSELKIANEAIVERVRQKTEGQLDNLESIVSQTGLNTTSVKRNLDKFYRVNEDGAEGGPYIPAQMPAISDEANEMLESLDRLQAMRQFVSSLPLAVPMKNAEETSNFGHRIDPFNGSIAFHSGMDLVGTEGAKILSAADGTVISTGRSGAYGNMVDIDHGFGITTRYGHLSVIKVDKGDKIKKGDVIGLQGSTGRSTGAHLHYEVRHNGVAINPEKFLQTGRLLELGSAVSQN